MITGAMVTRGAAPVAGAFVGLALLGAGLVGPVAVMALDDAFPWATPEALKPDGRSGGQPPPAVGMTARQVGG